MTDTLQIVPIGEMMTSANPTDVLVAFGIGSCVAICLYDPQARVGGMLHAMLPGSSSGNSKGTPTRFVDRGVPLLLDALLEAGARRIYLHAYLCGGACMITSSGFEDWLKVGPRNVLAAQAALQAAGLRLRAQSVGGSVGRTVRLHIASGQVTVKTLEQGEQVLTQM